MLTLLELGFLPKRPVGKHINNGYAF